MKVPGFIGGSSSTQAATADQEMTMNWYFEPIESPGSSIRAALYPTPGVEQIATGASAPGRAHFFENGREFAVIGPTLYEIGWDGTLTNRGTVAIDENPATISSNGEGGDQLFITSGGNGYYYNLTTNVLTQIAALNGLATMGDFIDGYFLCLDVDTSTLYLSALLDGSSWTTGVDFAQRSKASDPWVSMKVSGPHVWLLGEVTSEVWYNSGGSFPFEPHPSGSIQYGCAATFSPAIAEGQMLWLGASKFGDGYVLRVAGFSPEVVSTFATQSAFNGFSTVDDAQAFAYSDLGHVFYVLSFPSAKETWVLDTTTMTWAQRGTWNAATHSFRAWRPRWHARAFAENRMLDAESGGVYRVSSAYTTDVEDLPIRRVRRSPAMQTENERLFYSSFELDLEPGLGTATGDGANPQVMLRMSDDGGKTWGIERWRKAGKIGEYGTRVRWNRLGSARRRVFEVSVTDPIPWRLTGAYIELGQRPSSIGGGGA